MRPSVAESRHRVPKVTPNGLRNRPGDDRKSMKSPCFDLGGALGALGASRATPPTPKMSKTTLFFMLAKHPQQLRCCRSAGTPHKTSRLFSPPGYWFQTLAILLSSASACEKIGDGPVPPASASKNADGPDLPVIFHDPQTQQRQASPCSHSPQRGG